MNSRINPAVHASKPAAIVSIPENVVVVRSGFEKHALRHLEPIKMRIYGAGRETEKK